MSASPQRHLWPFPDRTYIERPALETSIEFAGKASKVFYSIIDSGADSSVFPSIYGLSVDLNLTSGARDPTLGATGRGTLFITQSR